MRTFSILLVLVTSVAVADPPDESLNLLLNRSGYAILAEVLNEPAKEEKAFYWQLDGKDKAEVFSCRVKVLEQLHHPDGKLRQKEMIVFAFRPEGAGCPELLKKGKRCVVFLKWIYGGPASTSHVTIDPWFAVQPANPKMIELLRAQGRRPEPTN